MRSTFALTIATVAGLSAAQSTQQFNYPYTIDPNSVSSSDRSTWCANQIAQCPLICLQQPGVTSMTTVDNECDPDTLTYQCVCENNVSPNITQYSQTLPFYICQEWGNQCVGRCGGDSACQSSCRQDHPCGAQSPYRGNTSLPTTMSRTASASGTNKIPVTGFGGSTPTSAPGFNSNSGAAPSMMPGAGMGLAAILGSAFLGFAILL